METFADLRERRLSNGISLLRIQKEMDCSYTWLRDLESGRVIAAPCVPKWKERYIIVLELLIKERDELVEQCR